jgi:putative membrane protein
MIRFYIMVGFALMFALIHAEGQLNKFINTKYAYLSLSAIGILVVLSIVEVGRLYLLEQEEKQRQQGIRGIDDPIAAPNEQHDQSHDPHAHKHDHHEHEDHGHSHGSTSKFRRTIGYLILSFPIFTGIFLPVQTLDSSFVKAKGFSFPGMDSAISADNPGQHQFLKPDSSVFYSSESYKIIKNNELSDFTKAGAINLTDQNYMKGMEVIYNFPGEFMGKTISFNGFAYKGEQIDGDHYFIFRFGFIHCAADSGVFGMLVDFPKGTNLKDDEWVHVTGTLSSELYQPFKQTIPVLKVSSYETIPEPDDPYVYRIY